MADRKLVTLIHQEHHTEVLIDSSILDCLKEILCRLFPNIPFCEDNPMTTAEFVELLEKLATEATAYADQQQAIVDSTRALSQSATDLANAIKQATGTPPTP